jgi:hypothetical protein
MTSVEFFWDPVCPWAWITSRWIVEVAAERSLEVDWKFISLRFVNKDRDYAATFPEGYERIHTQGLRLLRVASAVRAEAGRGAIFDLYTAYGEIIHDARSRDTLYDTSAIAEVLSRLGHKRSLADAADSTDHDGVIMVETNEALERCGGFIGTPVLTFAPPDGPSFFGPVVARVPKGEEALTLWDAAVTLATHPHFAELKRTKRGTPDPSR